MEKYYYAPTTFEESKMERAHRKKALSIAEETIVLLKNDGTLPIKNIEKRIALYGNGARNTVKGGSGSGEVASRDNISLETAFKNAGYEIVSSKWMDENNILIKKEHDAYMSEKRKQAEESGIDIMNLILQDHFVAPDVMLIDEKEIKNVETVIYVISRSAGEGADRKLERGDYYLSENEMKNLKILSESNANLILLINASGVIDTAELLELKGINAIINMGQLGNIGNIAVVKVIEGEVNPSGKLASTWAKKYEDYPSASTFSYMNGNLDDEFYEEDIYVGYRYFDAQKIEPQYEFGYGLSYTLFDINTVKVYLEASITGKSSDLLCLDVEVENIGMVSGKEVVQIYHGYPARACKSLIAFEKTKLLEKQEKQNITLKINLNEISTYEVTQAAWMILKGYYPIYVGNSSKNVKLVGYINATEDIMVEQLENKFGAELENVLIPEFEKIIPEESSLKIEIKSSNIKAKTITYQENRKILIDQYPSKVITMEDVKTGHNTLEELVAQLSPEEMAELCVGSFGEDKVQVVMGSSSSRVPGAGGNTTIAFQKTRKIDNLIMSDGPAGIRLTPHFQIDQDGKLHIPKEMGKSTVEGMLDYYQFCTALPISSNMAQSWNKEILKKAATIVAEEMDALGVNLWLAPAMNIHRNPLGGRCFEYYSEDPYLTGVCASVITKTIQNVHGCGVVLKHYAANNQEDNRMYTNVHVTERALREIYLRGFGKVIRETNPTGIMTAYNMINGTHCSNNKELIDDVARSEFGFNGLVMTDWFATYDMEKMMGIPKQKYERSFGDICIKSGNDLVMPGGDNCIEEILEGYKKGTINLVDLQYCTLNILNVIMRLK